MVQIRPASITDIASITSIYNDAILNTTATFDTEPKSIDDRMVWFKNHGTKYPVLVAESENKIVGWASLTQWSDRCAYEKTAEVSVYVHKEHRGNGIGKMLLEQLVLAGEKAGIHYMLARITEGNKISIHLHELFGFAHIGVMKEVGFKFGKFLDVTLMEKVISSNN
ncbi:MAG: GNAT family N-acetyltransferase [Bacteroidia bacterium]